MITHNHEDHLDSVGLSKITNSSKIISNKNTSEILKKSGITDLTVLSWKQKIDFNIKSYKIEIEAIPAIHGVNPLSALFAGKVNGYYLTISNGNESIRIYITGDTVYKNKVIEALKNKEIDLLIPNVGAAKQGSWLMTLTLNSKMLKKMISKLNPEIVVPVHYGAFEHYTEPVENIKEIHDERIRIMEVGGKIELKIDSARTKTYK